MAGIGYIGLKRKNLGDALYFGAIASQIFLNSCPWGSVRLDALGGSLSLERDGN